MIRDPKDLTRYNASERANHWTVGICFILLVLSGLAVRRRTRWGQTSWRTLTISSPTMSTSSARRWGWRVSWVLLEV